MIKISTFVSVLILGIYSGVLADNYGKIRTGDADIQNVNEWNEQAGILEKTEKWEERKVIGGKTVEFMRNVQTGRLIGKDNWGNIYRVSGNTTGCGKIIDLNMEITTNAKMAEKWEGRETIDVKTVELRRNVQTRKLRGTDTWGNIYGVVGNTDSKGKILDPSKETIENAELIEYREKPIVRNGKKVFLTRNKQTRKLNGKDAWGNCYGVDGNTSSKGKIIDRSKETNANVKMLE
jgi:hypothetical protein